MTDNITLPPGNWTLDRGNDSWNIEIKHEEGPSEVPVQSSDPVTVTNTDTGENYTMYSGQELRNGAVITPSGPSIIDTQPSTTTPIFETQTNGEQQKEEEEDDDEDDNEEEDESEDA